MSRLSIITPDYAQTVVENLYKDIERRITASPPGICPIDISNAFLKMCHAQTCGKCVPCRVGLTQLSKLMDDVLDGNATMEHIDIIEKTARVIKNTADCAIGYEAANMVLKGVVGFRDDYIEHIENKRCRFNIYQPVPCVSLCPAGVDIPGYIALVNDGRCADAVRLIRKDNPFPVSCAFVCEHPCEARCRRNMIDDSINIRALKRYAVDHSGIVLPPEKATSTGKKVAIIGGGPSGLSAAYYLSLMGHSVEVFEKREKLGGMLRYGIPSYRLPRERLQEDIECILSTGVKVHTGVEISKDITIPQLNDDFDCIYIAIGAHNDKKIGIDGEDKRGVISAVEMLRSIGDNTLPDFTKKRVVVVGGGNVAMDCTRSAKRLGAESVTCVYRRRRVDMTALPEEIEGAESEGCEILCLQAPVKISGDEDGNVTSIWVQPQLSGEIDKSGRPKPVNANTAPIRLACDIIIAAVGQGIEIQPFEEFGVKVKRGVIDTLASNEVTNIDGIFAGGDCVTGPATVIRAIAAGKVAAANIDEYLGFNHIISTDVEVPLPRLNVKPACGRMNTKERSAGERNSDFNLIETGLTQEEALLESSRCLRCDHYGYGIFKGGRIEKW